MSDTLSQALFTNLYSQLASNNICCSKLESLNRYYCEIIKSNTQHEWMYIKSNFIDLNTHTFILDIAVFNSLSNVIIKFSLDFEYLNSFVITQKSHRNNISVYIVYSDNAFIINHIHYGSNKITHTQSRKCLPIIKHHLLYALSDKNAAILSNISTNTLKHPALHNFLKVHDLRKLKKLSFNNIMSSVDRVESDIQDVSLTLQNTDFIYDIDGISAFADQNDILGIKSNINIDYSSKRHKTICSKDRFIYYKSQIFPIKKVFNCRIGSIYLSHKNSIDLHLVIPKLTSAMSQDNIKDLKDSIGSLLEKEIREFVNSGLMNQYYPLISLLNKKNHLTLNAVVNSAFCSHFLTATRKFLNKNALFFLEAYNTKYCLVDKNPFDLLQSLSAIFNLNIIMPKIDLCLTARLKNNLNSLLCMKDHFISKFKNISQYTLMNCRNISNFHGSLIKISSSKNKILRLSAGLEKINFYSPIVTYLFPKSYRNIKLPVFSSNILALNLYGWSPDLNHRLYYKKMRRSFTDLLSSIQNKLHVGLGIRAEIKVSLFNFLSAKDYLESSLLNKSFGIVDSAKIIDLLASNLKILSEPLIQTNHPNTFDSISHAIIHEQAFFEYYVRGGSNINLLPKSASQFFNDIATEHNLLLMPSLSNYRISKEERDIMLIKTLKYTSHISKDAKLKIKDLLSFSTAVSLDIQLVTLMNSFTKEIAAIHNFSESVFSLGTDKYIRKTASPISISQFYLSFFTSPPKNLKNCLYIGFYQYLAVLHTEIFIKDRILSLLNDNKIKFVPFKVSQSNIIIREIIYGSIISDEEINSKIQIVQSSTISYSLYKTQLKNIQSMQNSSRDPNVSFSEFCLIFFALNNDNIINGQKIKLISDLRYPFYTYCSKSRLYSAHRTLKTKISKGFDPYSIIQNFDPNNFTILSFVLFLNINKYCFANIEAIVIADELLSFSKNIETFNKKLQRFYSLIYENQNDYSDKLDYMNILFNNDIKSLEYIYHTASDSSLEISNQNNTLDTFESFNHQTNNKISSSDRQSCESNSKNLNTISNTLTTNIATSYKSNIYTDINPNNNADKILDNDNILFQYTDDIFLLTPRGRNCIMLLSNSTKKKFILLKKTRSILLSNNYDYDTVVNFLKILLHQNLIHKKDKKDTFIFAFKNEIFDL